MRRPLIALTCDLRHGSEDERTGGKLELNLNYARMVADAGGNPVLVTPVTDLDDLAPLINGWLITGGRDIDASRFGQTNHPSVELQSPTRWETERRLFDSLPVDRPILGVCYGSQFLNVVLGGDLEQHLPDRLGHEDHTHGAVQTYEVVPGTRLHAIVGDRLSGKSYHHQAVGSTAPGLIVSARHPDGTIEAIESPDRWLIGVQWHPERSLEDDPRNRKLVEAFVAAARVSRSN
jgi:putative glutamine amidotransferase